MKTTQTKCGKCSGKGTLSWTRNANGVCFACGGAGVFLVDEAMVAEHKIPRAECIAKIQRSLTSYAENGYSDEMYTLAFLIVRADADVAERALAAFERSGGIRSNLERQVEADRAMLGRRIAAVRKVA